LYLSRRYPITIEIKKCVRIAVENSRAMVFLLHFDPPYRHARHRYVSALDRATLDRQLAAVHNGGGNGLLFAAKANGVAIEVVRSWDGGRCRAQQLRKCGSAARACPTCRPRLHVRA
jgi:hypothetical protein